jgi:hypothetical protein
MYLVMVKKKLDTQRIRGKGKGEGEREEEGNLRE